MVARLYGKCNGADIVLCQDEQGRWVTAVPSSSKSTYILELWAEDVAGNVGYFATVRVTYDPEKIRTKFEILNVGAQFTMRDVLFAFGCRACACEGRQ